MSTEVPREHLFCYRCGHYWVPRDGAPKRCPRCHSCRWDVPERSDRVCAGCGTAYRATAVNQPCPGCGMVPYADPIRPTIHCNQCDYDWMPRVSGKPVKCPMCGSREWDLPKAECAMCQQCGHVWRVQSGKPERCPSCQSKIWNQPLRAVRCQRCGHVWKMRASRSPGSVSVCPSCKSRRWEQPLQVARRERDGRTQYLARTPSSRTLVSCSSCGHRWYTSDGMPEVCPSCGSTLGYRDRITPTSMTLWTDGRFELDYVTENGYGCVYLWDDDTPVACRYMHEILRGLALTISQVIDSANDGSMSDRWKDVAERMYAARLDYTSNIDYFMKRLSLDRRDARILALHFTGMGPEAISRCLGLSLDEVNASFDRIMRAYSDSGIVVDDTVFTEEPMRLYG